MEGLGDLLKIIELEGDRVPSEPQSRASGQQWQVP